MYKPRRVFGIPVLDGLIIDIVEALGSVAFLIIMVPLTLVILVLSFVLVFAVTISLAFVLEVVGVPPESSNGLLALVGIAGGLGLTFFLCVKAFKRLPGIRRVIAPEPSPEPELAPSEPGRLRRHAQVVLAEVAELDARFAPETADDHGRS